MNSRTDLRAPGSASPTRILRRGEVTMRTGLSNTTIFRLIQDGKFPAAIPLGRRAVGWFEHEIDAWLQQQAERRNG